jgi:hypothetical protein
VFIGKTIIYPDLQKTGSTHIRRLLMSLPEEEGVKFRKHTPFCQIPPQDLQGWDDKVKLGSIRNPWAWYVSLWAYGCSGRGDIHNKTTRFQWRIFKQRRNFHYLMIPRHSWRDAYSDHSPKGFKAWLELMFSPKHGRDLGEYGRSPISEHSGLYTYRYLRLHTLGFDSHTTVISTRADILEWDRRYNFINHVIRQEQLNEDFLAFIQTRGIPPSPQTFELLQGKSNTSPHAHYQDYYDGESEKWVREKEWFIIGKYGYDF